MMARGKYNQCGIASQLSYTLKPSSLMTEIYFIMFSCIHLSKTNRAHV